VLFIDGFFQEYNNVDDLAQRRFLQAFWCLSFEAGD
jgi:hypothetical protein